MPAFADGDWAELKIFSKVMNRLDHLIGEFVGCRRGFESGVRARVLDFLDGLDHCGKDFTHFLFSASRKESNKIRVTRNARALGFERVEHGMPDKDSGQSALRVQWNFEGKDAEH